MRLQRPPSPAASAPAGETACDMTGSAPDRVRRRKRGECHTLRTPCGDLLSDIELGNIQFLALSNAVFWVSRRMNESDDERQDVNAGATKHRNYFVLA